MSIEAINTTTEQESFPKDKNIRVLIEGLALCDFDRINTFRFLRHVLHHQLLMTINQKKRDDVEYIKTLTIKLEKNQNVEILGAEVNQDTNDLSDLLKMQNIHGKEIIDRDKDELPEDLPTTLKVENCNFSSHLLTNNKYSFDDTNRTIRQAKKYCAILKGDMFFANDFTIFIDGSFPYTFPIDDNYYYEIVFNNSCDSTPQCGEEEDYKYYYDIVREADNPHRRFKMLKHGGRSPVGTGACLPTCTRC